jgi:hypothetical protein
MTATPPNLRRPTVQIIGNVDHPDFAESISLIAASASLVVQKGVTPELVIVAQSRPGEVTQCEVHSIQQRHPLTGIIGLLGSWCEGETRTGRPWSGVTRLYWYDFPSWWRQQLSRYARGLCPDWATPFSTEASCLAARNRQSKLRNLAGLIVLSTEYADMAEPIADVLAQAGFAIVQQPRGQSNPIVRGATAAIWEGGQLSDEEADDLTRFCQRFSNDGTPVIALFDFPRHDAVARARAAGATIVLGKPWLNANLIGALHLACEQQAVARAA